MRQFGERISTPSEILERNSAMVRSDGEFLVSVVDEAHALINPEHVEGRGQFGFVTGLGPQAYHIMRVSQVTIFLLDERQKFPDAENTSIADIRNWAAELGAEFYTVSLTGHQFAAPDRRNTWIGSRHTRW